MGDKQIINISCTYKEYRLISNKWVKTAQHNYFCGSRQIEMMQECAPYYAQLGGYMTINHKNNRRFGLVVDKIVSVSICRCVKKVFMFNYNLAQVDS